jgi:hypothetical protein
MIVSDKQQSSKIDSEKISEAINRPGCMKSKDFLSHLRDAGVEVLGSIGHGRVQVRNPDNGKKGYVNLMDKDLNKAYRKSVTHTLGILLRTE